MRMAMVSAVAAMTLAVGGAQAGTLTIEWIGGPQLAQENGVEDRYWEPYEAAFIFSVPYLKPFSFTYSEAYSLDYDYETGQYNYESETYNPFDATLISMPDVPCCSYGEFGINLVGAGVQLYGGFLDSSYQTSLGWGSKNTYQGLNQNQVNVTSSGYWTAVYVANSPAEGESFELLAPIPLPASVTLLGAALAGLGFMRRRR